MSLAISTHWNANRHRSGERMVLELLELGFRSIELGYDLSSELVDGVRKMVEKQSITVNSVHNYCPIPLGAPFGHPELYKLTSLNNYERKTAVAMTFKTVEFARDIGARYVVTHAGRVDMKNITMDLIKISEEGKQFKPRFEKMKMKMFMKREKLIKKHMDQLYKSLEELIPQVEPTGVAIALENLPSWQAIPSESEMEEICTHFNTPALRYWHDMGHAQTRQNLGLMGHRLWLEKLKPWLVGMHVHDVATPAFDHIMPPAGDICFDDFKSFIDPNIVLVLEPASSVMEQEVTRGKEIITKAWGLSA